MAESKRTLPRRASSTARKPAAAVTAKAAPTKEQLATAREARAAFARVVSAKPRGQQPAIRAMGVTLIQGGKLPAPAAPTARGVAARGARTDATRAAAASNRPPTKGGVKKPAAKTRAPATRKATRKKAAPETSGAEA